MGRLFWAVALATLGTGCGEAWVGGDAGGSVDAGSVDAASADGGSLDGAAGDADAGPSAEDAGATVDGATADAAVGGDAGADGDAAVIPDAGTPADAGGACAATDLLLAAIDPGTASGPGAGSIVIYNASGGVVHVDSTDYLLHEDPDSVFLRDLEAGVTILAGEVHRFPYPAAFSDGNASGELALFREASSDAPSALIDFVCWGFGHGATFSVRPVAEADGDWSGPCAPSISGVEMRRIPETDGRHRSSYDPTGLAPLYSCH